MRATATGWVGRSIERLEDGALLSGSGRYLNDLPVGAGIVNAALDAVEKLREGSDHA